MPSACLPRANSRPGAWVRRSSPPRDSCARPVARRSSRAPNGCSTPCRDTRVPGLCPTRRVRRPRHGPVPRRSPPRDRLTPRSVPGQPRLLGVSWHVRVIANRYADSVRLMSIARAVRERDGVTRCELGMGTPANLGVLAGYGAQAEATPGDLVIAVDAHDGAAAEALAWAEQELSSPSQSDDSTGGDGRLRRARPRSVAAAARELDGANVALISVPGEYAALEAHRALSSGMHVFLFSDHVPLDAEIELKRRGAELGLLVMGPECGTAMLGGVGLGFANVVAPGPVGIVAAAGTGAQESACLLDAAGVGVSHIVGVGGRDLLPEVGATMFRLGMDLLARDADTDTLLLVSKS